MKRFFIILFLFCWIVKAQSQSSLMISSIQNSITTYPSIVFVVCNADLGQTYQIEMSINDLSFGYYTTKTSEPFVAVQNYFVFIWQLPIYDSAFFRLKEIN